MTLFDKAWLAPAKLNLFLHITGQRKDGYHLLQTAFQFLDYSDELYFDLRNDDKVKLLTPFEGVAPEDNLIVKAALMIQQRLAKPQGISIQIKKKLPIGGGLGGGSSNAATVLIALNEIWKIGLSSDELAKIGLMLGADVPVFIHGVSAWAEGIGEKLQPINPPTPCILVLSPGVQVSTAKIFTNSRLTRNCPAITIRDFLEAQISSNVCEDVVTDIYPEVAKALKFLDTTQITGRARMTGTGSCVFAPYDSQEQATLALKKLPCNWNGFVAQACNRSPLYTANESSKV